MCKVEYYTKNGSKVTETGFTLTRERKPKKCGIKEIVILNGYGFPIKTKALFTDGAFYRYGNRVNRVIWWKNPKYI